MGIPSYFRRILQKYPGCLTRKIESLEGSILCFDFNCLIYRCLYSKTLRPYPVEDEEDQNRWEGELLDEIVKITKEVWIEAGRPERVYIAVDGVVPMAKVRQQRVRRFKSVWLKSRASKPESWDTNSITPGTEFMERLGRKLDRMCKERKGWSLSGVRESGEGEHKILQWLRSQPLTQIQSKRIIIYGLDADLILLSMLLSEELNSNINLMRETQEFEKTSESGYTFLQINEFKEKCNIKCYNDVINYIGLMSLMGNDFLPHSLTHKLNDDGYNYILQEYESMKKTNRFLIIGGKMQEGVFREITNRWSAQEESKMQKMIDKKIDQSKRGVLDGMSVEEGYPLQWMEERCMINSENKLIESWREEYWKKIHPVADEDTRVHLCKEYRRGFQWIIDYYTGKEVDIEWMYPAWMPPLWSELGKGVHMEEIKQDKKEWYSAEEQLVMVLPLESWGLVRAKEYRNIPSLAPQYWPKEFSYFSFGRKWLWECEALIPVLTNKKLRGIKGN